MSIVLNEYEWAERAIEYHDLGKKPIETLNRVAKYYYENQYKRSDIRKMLDTFMVQCDPAISLVHWSDTLDRVVRNVGRYKLIRLDGISITDKELQRIETIDGKQVRRLAFTLLCVAKYWDNVSDSNNHWVNSPDREIMQMANINTSIKRQSMMFATLRECGFIRFSKKIDNLNVRVVIVENGKEAIRVQDFRNLGYQYMKHCGGPYFECVNCGITVKIQEPSKGRRQKYCQNCAIEIKTRQNVNAVMRHRNASKS